MTQFTAQGGERLAGAAAQQRLTTHPEDTFASMKVLMGLRPAEVPRRDCTAGPDGLLVLPCPAL